MLDQKAVQIARKVETEINKELPDVCWTGQFMYGKKYLLLSYKDICNKHATITVKHNLETDHWFIVSNI